MRNFNFIRYRIHNFPYICKGVRSITFSRVQLIHLTLQEDVNKARPSDASSGPSVTCQRRSRNICKDYVRKKDLQGIHVLALYQFELPTSYSSLLYLKVNQAVFERFMVFVHQIRTQTLELKMISLKTIIRYVQRFRDEVNIII